MYRTIWLVAAWVGFIGLTSGAAHSADANHPAAGIVAEFNTALSTRDLDLAMALIADGGVQYHLRPAHPGMPTDHALTEDMKTLWQTATAILFPSTESYTRDIKIKNVTVDGELAVVWIDTHVETLMKNANEPRVHDFSEMYFLVNKNDAGWKIAGTATNRPVDELDVGGTN